MTNAEQQKLSNIGAVWNAFLLHDIGHYPRFRVDGIEQKIDDDKIIEKIFDELRLLNTATKSTLAENVKCARESLDEVKALTEYEDAKAGRVVTIVTIFGALAGLIFTRLADTYPFRAAIDLYGGISWQTALILMSYILFLGFVLFGVSGALVIFHATRVRFKYPELKPGSASDKDTRARSFLFYKEIIQVPPENWARSFLTEQPASKKRTIRQDLTLGYFKNYVVESYLVAAKVADKLRYLEPAHSILAASLRILLVWLLVSAITFALVPTQTKPGANTSTSSIEGAKKSDRISPSLYRRWP